jgi:hypothetical protein
MLEAKAPLAGQLTFAPLVKRRWNVERKRAPSEL